MTQEFLYRTDEIEPVPCVQVNVSDLSGAAVMYDLDAKLDSGATRTIVPESILLKLRSESQKHSQIETIGGQSIMLPVHHIWLMIRGFPAVVAEVAADQHESVILLGRDVMNEFVITLDGPGRRVHVERP